MTNKNVLFWDTRNTLLSGFLCWLSVGLIACALLMQLGWWLLGGFLLLASSAIAEFVHVQSSWRVYLAAPYTNNNSLWVTKDSYATAAGLSVNQYENQHFYKLVNVARSSFSPDKLRNDFVRRIGGHYDKIAHFIAIGMALLGTAVTLRA